MYKELDKEGQYVYQPTKVTKELLLKMIIKDYNGDSPRFKVESYNNKFFKFEKIKRKELEKY